MLRTFLRELRKGIAERRCPKCGAMFSTPKYDAREDVLRSECIACGYQKTMAPLDRTPQAQD